MGEPAHDLVFVGVQDRDRTPCVVEYFWREVQRAERAQCRGRSVTSLTWVLSCSPSASASATQWVPPPHDLSEMMYP